MYQATTKTPTPKTAASDVDADHHVPTTRTNWIKQKCQVQVWTDLCRIYLEFRFSARLVGLVGPVPLLGDDRILQHRDFYLSENDHDLKQHDSCHNGG